MPKNPAVVDHKMQKITNPKSRPGNRAALLAAGTMAFAGIGDAVLYPVLPVYAEKLGVPLVWVGVLLSANRLVRVLSNTWVANVIRKYGAKSVLLISTVLASICTGLYGLHVGIFGLLAARIVWGLCYSGLKTATFSFAAQLSAAKGLAFGLVHSIRSLGVVLALVLGPLLINQLGVSDGFLVLAVLSVLAIPLVWSLPVGATTTASVKIRKTFAPTPLNMITFTFSFAIDGVVVVALATLLEDSATNVATLLTMVASYLLLSRLFMVGGSFLAGMISLRISSFYLFVVSVIICLIGLTLIATGQEIAGIVITFFFNAVLTSFTPLMAVSMNESNHLQSLSGVSTWWDLGAGAGAFLGLMLIDLLGQRNLFFVVSALGIIAVVNFLIYHAKSNRHTVSAAIPLHQKENSKH